MFKVTRELGFRPLTGIKASLTYEARLRERKIRESFRPLTGIKASLTGDDSLFDVVGENEFPTPYGD